MSKSSIEKLLPIAEILEVSYECPCHSSGIAASLQVLYSSPIRMQGNCYALTYSCYITREMMLILSFSYPVMIYIPSPSRTSLLIDKLTPLPLLLISSLKKLLPI